MSEEQNSAGSALFHVGLLAGRVTAIETMVERDRAEVRTAFREISSKLDTLNDNYQNARGAAWLGRMVLTVLLAGASLFGVHLIWPFSKGGQ